MNKKKVVSTEGIEPIENAIDFISENTIYENVQYRWIHPLIEKCLEE